SRVRLVETQQPCRSGEYAEEPVFLRLDYYQMFHCFSPACFRMLFTVPRAGSSFGFRAKYKTPFASMLELLMTFLLRSKYYSPYCSSETTLMKPSWLLMMLAFEFAVNGNFPIFTL